MKADLFAFYVQDYKVIIFGQEVPTSMIDNIAASFGMSSMGVLHDLAAAMGGNLIQEADTFMIERMPKLVADDYLKTLHDAAAKIKESKK